MNCLYKDESFADLIWSLGCAFGLQLAETGFCPRIREESWARGLSTRDDNGLFAACRPAKHGLHAAVAGVD
jgi:hypothetical protein